MNVIAINGSPNKKGNTHQTLEIVGAKLKESGIDFEIIHTGHKLTHGCIGCGQCIKNRDEKCCIKNDSVNEVIQQMKSADGIILGAPVYFSGIPGTMKSFLDRAFYVAAVNGGLFRHKVGATVVTLRRTGGSATFDQLNHFLNYSEMILATSNYWNIIHGRLPGEILQDAEGLKIMDALGKNMAWILKMREQTKKTLHIPEQEQRVLTNFIR